MSLNTAVGVRMRWGQNGRESRNRPRDIQGSQR